MLDLRPLIPFIQKMGAIAANDDVSPEEVAAQIQKEKTIRQENKDGDNETVDSDAIEVDTPNKVEATNEEGEMLEQGFPELEIEGAIEKAKEEKQLSSNPGSLMMNKISYWDILKIKHGYAHHRR